MKSFIIVLIILVIAAVLVLATKNKSGKERVLSPEELARIEEERKKKGKTVYCFLNSLMKSMAYFYRTDTWDALTKIQLPEEMKDIDLEDVKLLLDEKSRDLLSDICSCISFEEDTCGDITDSSRLKDLFEKSVLPFYPAYYKVFDNDVRYIAFLNKDTLSLFRGLTGKKFRVGYKNRYSNGVTAFEWKGSFYQVYTREGKLLCDAEFKDGRIWNGFAVEEQPELSDDLWSVEQAGTYADGKFKKGTLQYTYSKLLS